MLKLKRHRKRSSRRRAPETLEVRSMLAADVASCTMVEPAASGLASEGEGDSTSAIAEAINQFNRTFYDRLEDDSGNLFYSPLSMAMAFGMLHPAANDAAAAEIEALFGFDDLGDQLHSAFDSLMDRLNAAPHEALLEILATDYHGDPPDPTELTIGNAFFTQENAEFNQTYRDVLSQYYEAIQPTVDFAGDPEGAAEEINEWAFDATEGRIPEIITPEVAAQQVALLANAVYFKNPWLKPFDAEDTRMRAFTRYDGTTVDAEMMQQTDYFRYMDQDGFRVVELPHMFGRFSSVFILPDDPANIDSSSLPADLDGWLEGMSQQRVNLSLPKFGMQMTFQLEEMLTDLGVEEIFEPNSLPNAGGNLNVSYVRQDTFFEMDESGSEAAAVTSIGLEVTSVAPVPKVFQADHPFHFLIRDNESGAIMFMGRQMDPSMEGKTDAPDLANPPHKPPGIWHNADNPFDVDRSGGVTINDAMLLVGQLRTGGPRTLPTTESLSLIAVTHLYDVNNDDMLTLSDAIATARHIGTQMAFAAAEAEASLSDDSDSDSLFRPLDAMFAEFGDE